MKAPRSREPDRSATDVVSDPARNDQTGNDWSTEGGATPSGPATDVGETDDPADES